MLSSPTGIAVAVDEGLVGVPLKPSRIGLPLRQWRVIVTNRHLDLRQTLSVDYLVLRDDIVEVQQEGRQRVDLVGSQRPLSIERHGAIDVIPDRRRKRRTERQYSRPFPDVGVGGRWRFQDGSQAADAG